MPQYIISVYCTWHIHNYICLPENWTSQILALEYSMKRHWNYAHHSILFIYAGWWSSKYASRTYYLEDCYKSCCDLYLCNGQHPHLDRNIVIFSKKFMKQSRVISPSFFCSDLGYPKLSKFYEKNEWASRKMLYFVNWCNAAMMKSEEIILSFFW